MNYFIFSSISYMSMLSYGDEQLYCQLDAVDNGGLNALYGATAESMMLNSIEINIPWSDYE